MNWVVLLWIIDIIYITIHTVENMIWMSHYWYWFNVHPIRNSTSHIILKIKRYEIYQDIYNQEPSKIILICTNCTTHDTFIYKYKRKL